MALSAKLQLRQSQALVMTPQLMQSIKLLQFTHAELDAFIDQEIERNPLLERRDGDDLPSTPQDDAPQPEAHASNDDEWFETGAPPSSDTMAGTLDTSLENVFPDDNNARELVSPDLAASWKSGAGPRSTGGFEDFDLEDVARVQPSLRDHVGEQIAMSGLGHMQSSIAWDLTDSLDETGYLRAELDETAVRLGVPVLEVEKTLAICQTFEPAGLFARDLSECLALQLKAKDRLDPAMAKLLENLPLLARRDFAALMRICGVDQEDLTQMMAEIRALDPRPGLAFTSGSLDTIVPDVNVRPNSDGSWAVELNTSALPHVLIDNVYYAEVSSAARSREDREFISECLQNANWLTRSLDQRARTILKVASEIVRQQDGFLAYGIRHLRPLNLKTVADAIGMHESTVSRVTAHKYMATPRGVFELRFFFTAAIQSAQGGEAHSSEAVRDRIRALIGDEGDETLSDDAIVDILRKDGVDIARRTVAKYRESMNILSSVQRRREKRAQAAA
ncbi:MAG: RNA polymerase factor sigma-54 [Rhizobiaceae bacterium]|nr:RNA polymerase factor sigma-54 [Rhizobiaceae bacterium]